MSSSESWFDSTYGGKCPTWSTVSLIFNSCQGRPISRGGWGICWDVFFECFSWWLSSQVDGNEFFLGQVCELIFSHGVCLCWISIVSFNLFDFFFINLLSVEFFSWCVCLSVLCCIIFKSQLIINWAWILQLVEANCKECYGCQC